MYGIEVNLPFQVQEDYKERVMARVVPQERTVLAPNGQELTYESHDLSFTRKPSKQFATEDEASAKALAETYAPSWNAVVVPVTEGYELTAEQLEPIIERERKNATTRRLVERNLSIGR